MIITLLAVFLAGIVVEHAWIRARKLYCEDELHHARAEANFWREQYDQWHNIAVKLGTSKRRVRRIMVPDPPEQQIIAAGKVGLKVWMN